MHPMRRLVGFSFFLLVFWSGDSLFCFCSQRGQTLFPSNSRDVPSYVPISTSILTPYSTMIQLLCIKVLKRGEESVTKDAFIWGREAYLGSYVRECPM